MKQIFSILMLALIAIGCSQASANSSYKKPDAPERQGWPSGRPLYGDVESITQVSYVLEDKFGKIKRGETIAKTITYFNEAGDVTEHIKYYSGGTLNRKYIYKYDAAGNRTEGALFDPYVPLDSYMTKRAGVGTSGYNYDAAGNRTEGARYNSYGLLNDKYIYKYDAAGNMTEWAWYDSDGSLYSKYIYKYDAAGNMTEEARYNSDGSLNEKSICNYDAAGNMTEIAIYKSDGSRNYKWIYKYDDVGNVTGWTEYVGEIMTPIEEVEVKIVYRK